MREVSGSMGHCSVLPAVRAGGASNREGRTGAAECSKDWNTPSRVYWGSGCNTPSRVYCHLEYSFLSLRAQLKPDSEWPSHTNGALRKPGEA